MWPHHVVFRCVSPRMINQRALLCIVRQLANHKGPEHAKGRYSVGRFHYALFGGAAMEPHFDVAMYTWSPTNRLVISRPWGSVAHAYSWQRPEHPCAGRATWHRCAIYASLRLRPKNDFSPPHIPAISGLYLAKLTLK